MRRDSGPLCDNRSMNIPEPEEFARIWLDAWNSHDLEAVLAHFSEDVVFTSPLATRLLPETGGVIRGKEALRGYWTEGLRRIPDLHFEIVGVYAGTGSIVINYRNQKGGLVNEVLLFTNGLISAGHGTYLT